MITNLRVSLFGALRLEQDGKPVSLATSPGVRIVLAYLLLHRQEFQSREELVGRLWPDLPEARSRDALRYALWHINHGLPGLLQKPPDRYAKIAVVIHTP